MNEPEKRKRQPSDAIVNFVEECEGILKERKEEKVLASWAAFSIVVLVALLLGSCWTGGVQ